MKMTRNILRRVELKIYHAMTAEQMKKNVASESQQKQNPPKSVEESSK
jgi:hypothetical protein